ncbi:MAG: amidohydrolase family protein [Acidobacteria bacterium]|nr:amidohydrolase family protein [Acidobacteriota bacterium]
MPRERLLLKNALIVDGTGAPPFHGGVLVEDGRIAQVGAVDAPADVPSVDCSGMAAAPGFIDAHSHSDLQVLEGRREKTLQGVTSEVVGNCGFSPFPTADARELHQFANGILCGGEHWGWSNAAEYLAAAEAAPAANVYAMAGHGSLRVAVAGLAQRPLTATEMDRIEGLLEDSLSAGAIGFSTGLMYAPGSCAPPEELERLCRIVARQGAIYATHMRSYSRGLLDAIREQIDLARAAGCRLQISHLQAVGPEQWPLQEPALELIERALEEGVDVAFDCYPYLAGNTNLTQLLPQWALDGGVDAMMVRLAGAERTRIAEESRRNVVVPWSGVIVTAFATDANRHLTGLSLEAIAEARGRQPWETLVDLVEEERGSATVITFNQSPENLRATLTHPLSIVISDGLFVRGKPHPRLHGTFPCFLETVCREKRWLTLPEAVHKITGRPAARFGLKERGLLRPGYHADVTVFEPERIGSRATYKSPDIPPDGLHLVLRNGVILESPGRGSGLRPNDFRT